MGILGSLPEGRASHDSPGEDRNGSGVGGVSPLMSWDHLGAMPGGSFYDFLEGP